MNFELTFFDPETEKAYSIHLTSDDGLFLVSRLGDEIDDIDAIEITNGEMFSLLDDHFKLVKKMNAI